MRRYLIIAALLLFAFGCKKSSSSNGTADTVTETDMTTTSDTTTSDTTTGTNLGPRDAPVFPQGSVSTNGVLTAPVDIVDQTIQLTKTTCQGGKPGLFGNWRYFVGGGPDDTAIVNGKIVMPDETYCN